MVKRTTLSDIAEETGVSVSMVSRVINGKACRISKEKRDLILEIAREKRYKPNQLARGLVSQRSGTFGLILPSITSRLYTSLTEELEKECNARGYGLFLANSGNTCEGDSRLIDLLDARGVDGIFIVPSYDSFSDPTIVEHLRAASVPVVFALRVLEDADWDEVIFDSEYGGYLAARHLIELGHTKIGCVANTRESNTGRLRFKGYAKALTEAGIDVNPAYILQSPYTMSGGYEAGKELLKTDVTAVFCGSDYIALGIRKAFLDAGKRVPEDYPMVAFDVSESDFLFDPPIPAIVQDITLLGKELFDVMQRRLDGETGEPIKVLLTPKLVLGDEIRQTDSLAGKRAL
ncbi:LacI family DNA-binding transcriptional regulator [Thermophilibacter sp.]|uniref:LacI family DNA-binding transcriptional regulator n=1 Tax=Thermophilibacter sp. TaxID=2847309 RepID=UPI003A951129